jgi:PiT family inorganic phosphate transporter
MDFLQHLHVGHLVFLLIALIIAFGFEFINGFHDTANAVATVIYTHSLRPTTAVVWSGIWNFLGVMIGGIGVAYSIVHLLPVELLIEADTSAGLAMVLSLLISAIVWNFATWYVGLPASSSHALIGSILGTGLANALLVTGSPLKGVNWGKAAEVGLALLLSPLVGFMLAGLLLLGAKRIIRNPELYQEPQGQKPPPTWVRGILIFTCTGVSFAHGSNDGQKGMGLIMLVLIGVIPTYFAIDLAASRDDIHQVLASAQKLDEFLAKEGQYAATLPNSATEPNLEDPDQVGASARMQLAAVQKLLLRDGQPIGSFEELTSEERLEFRTRLLRLQQDFASLEKTERAVRLSEQTRKFLQTLRKDLSKPIEYIPFWVKLGVALSLGIGTMVGWRRIVITVGEKIGKTHLTYAQGASAELVAMSTILMADVGGLPVSTTHVLSSGVAGTMAANGSGVQMKTIRNLLLAWVLTLPATMLLAGGLFWLSRLIL